MTASVLAVLGIAIPSVLLTLLVRRIDFNATPRVVLLFLLLSVAFVSPGLRPGWITVPVDEAVRGYPWHGVVGDVAPRNAVTNDTVKLFLPWHQISRDELTAGHAPIWNRYAFGGYPLLGNGESAPFSPFFIATLFVPLPKQLVAMAGLKIFAALLFTFLAARQRGISYWASCFSAVTFSLCVHQTVYLHYSAATVSALAPLALYALTWATQKAGAMGVMITALATGSLMAAGHPESVLHVAIGCGAVLIGDLVFSKQRSVWMKGFGRAMAGAILGLALAAPTWLPVLEQVRGSARIAEIASHRQMSAPFNQAAIWALINPDVFGNPAHGNWSWIYNYPVVASSYPGLLTLCLLPGVVARRVPKQAGWLAALSIILFLTAMNWTWLGLFNHLPPLSLVANDKLRFMSVLLAALAAGHVLSHLDRDSIAISIAASGVLGYFLWQVFSAHYGHHFGPAALVAPASVIMFWMTVAFSRAEDRRRNAGAAALLATTAELFAFNLPFNASADEKYYVPRLPIVEKVRELAPDRPFRIVGDDWTLIPNTPAQYGLEDIRGSDPMAWAPYIEFLTPISIDTPGADLRRIVDHAQPALDFLNVRFLLSGPGLVAPSGWIMRYEGEDGRLFESTEVLERFFAPAMMHELVVAPPGIAKHSSHVNPREVSVEGMAGESTANRGLKSMWIKQTRSTRFRLTINAVESVLIASSQPAMPGWRVTVNGKRTPITRVNGAFIGFRVPTGHSRVIVDYAPTSYTTGCALSVLAAAILIWLSRNERRGMRTAKV